MYLELLVFIFHLNCQYVYDAERSLPFLSFNFPQQWKSYLKKNKKKNKSSCMKVTEWSCFEKQKHIRTPCASVSDALDCCGIA